MPDTDDVPALPLTALVHREWSAFRRRGRILAVVAAVLVTVLPGLLLGYAGRDSCSAGPVIVACPAAPLGPDGGAVTDQFTFVHRPLADNGSITARLTSMTGIITYPPPDHDEIVPGLVPWAKAGLIVKDGLGQGSTYAALMVTGAHGVRMQYGYTHDVAGSPGAVSAQAPHWLRLTRSGDTVTGLESTDGTHWTEVGTTLLAGLPRTVQVGLFVTSPGNVTLSPVGLGGSLAESRFTQTTAVLDSIGVDGIGVDGAGGWSTDTVGESGLTDWERFHRPAGLVEADGTFTVTGSGDIGPAGVEGGRPVESTLVGLAVGLLVVIVVAVRFGTAGPRPGGRVLAARAVVIGAVTFVAGLVATGIAVPVGTAILRAGGNPILPTSGPTQLRVIVGGAALLAVAAVMSLTLGALLRRRWVAIPVAIATIVLPYPLAVLPLFSDDASDWLLRLTPAAGFAVVQTVQEYPQVVAHYAPSEGFFPLPWWAGLVVLCGYAAVGLGVTVLRRTTTTPATARWR